MTIWHRDWADPHKLRLLIQRDDPSVSEWVARLVVAVIAFVCGIFVGWPLP